MASTAQPLPLARRIIVSNLPLPAKLANSDSAEPAVEIVDERIDPELILDGQGARSSIFNNVAVPTTTAGSGKLELAAVPTTGAGIVLPNGVNVFHFEMAPNFNCPVHRTTTVDYVTVISGEVVLLTPGAAYDPETGEGEIIETLCKPGDVVVQRGTLHGWSNRTSDWIRLYCVVLDAEPISTKIDGSEMEYPLKDAWYI